MQNTVKSIRLAYRDGSSDKVYRAAILERDGKFSVECEYGRRGSTLSLVNKAKDTTLEKAEKAYAAVIKEKTGKGYSEVAGADGKKTLVGVEKTGGREILGSAAQLLNPIDEDELAKFLLSDEWVAQRKYDGVRILAHVGEQIQFTNRKGQVTVVSQNVEAALKQLPKGTILDGELLAATEGEDSVYYVFDILQVKGASARHLGYTERYELLSMAATKFGPAVRLAPVATTTAEKHELVEKLRSERAEGAVFKKTDAAYVSGRPASGGNQLKLKFTKTADVFLLAFDDKAYQMAVMHEGKVRKVGKVYTGTTVDERAKLDAILKSGTAPVIEVRYLYATESDILFQPVYVRLRPNDKTVEECLLSQLVRTNREVEVEVE